MLWFRGACGALWCALLGCQSPSVADQAAGQAPASAPEVDTSSVQATAVLPVVVSVTLSEGIAATGAPTTSTPFTEAQAPLVDVPDACKRSDFFDFYRDARMITTDSTELVRLQIHIDYHSGAGCLAPDSYGTDLIVKLHLRTVGGGCFIERASVRAVDWGNHPRLQGDPDGRRLRFDFAPFDVLQTADLSKPEAVGVVIHNPNHALSLLVRRRGVLMYEQTSASSTLHTSVDSQGEKSGCCWPSTSTLYREFGVYD